MLMSLFSLLAQNRNDAAPSNEIDLKSFTPPTTAYSTGSDDPTGRGALENLEGFISNIIGLLTVLGAIFFVIYFVIGAFQWITSGGDKGKLESARNRMMYGAIGMILIIGSYAILGLLGGVIGIDFLNPADQLQELIPN